MTFSTITTEKELWSREFEGISEEICPLGESEKELWSREFEGISEEICPLGECNNYSYLQILKFHEALIQVQKMRIKKLSDMS